MRRTGSLTVSLCHSVTLLVRTAALVLLTAAPAFAQGTTQVVHHERFPLMELFVTFALCAGAVFAVCRSSRRN
jgi:hypothetical protein